MTTELVTVAGKDFHIAERVGLMPMLKFATIAKAGVDADDLEGMVAMYELIRAVFDPADWPAFETHASDQRLDGDQLMEVVAQIMAMLTARPTVRPSDSSPGPHTTEPSSTDDSSSPVISRLNDKGRPDLALLVRKREESLAG